MRTTAMTLYLIHGALGAGSQLEPLRARLASSHDVRIVELAGHGMTRLGDRAFSIDGFAEQFSAQLESDGVERADVFGYSMGGYVALVTALRQGARINRVMTLGTKFEWTPEVAAHGASRLDATKLRAKAPKFAEMLETRHAGAGGWESNLSDTAALLHALGDRPLLDDVTLAEIGQRVCVAVGDRDDTVSVDESARAFKRLPQGALLVMPGTGHPLEHVDHGVLAAAMVSFLSS